MSNSKKTASSDASSDESTAGQILAQKYVDADLSMTRVALFCLEVCFGNNSEPDFVPFDTTKKDFKADAVLGRADVLGLTREDMARSDTIKTLDAYARKGWSRILYGNSPTDPNSVKALCEAQGREFIAPKKPVSKASQDAMDRKEANMTDAERAEAEAEAATKKATKAKMDATRSARDSIKTDVTRIANDLLAAIKNGDTEKIKAVGTILHRVSKAVQKETLALDKISES